VPSIPYSSFSSFSLSLLLPLLLHSFILFRTPPSLVQLGSLHGERCKFPQRAAGYGVEPRPPTYFLTILHSENVSDDNRFSTINCPVSSVHEYIQNTLAGGGARPIDGQGGSHGRINPWIRHCRLSVIHSL